METVDVNNFIETYDNLSIEDKEFLSEIIHKNLVESKRETLIQRVKEAEQNYETGNVKIGGLKELLKDLEDD